jgi:3-oxoacyl-[acyl-carrier protein] reductase
MTCDQDALATSLRGRTAIVTGSGRNIGRALAIVFAKNGAKVVVNGARDEGAVRETVGLINESGGSAIGVMADVGRSEEAARLVQGARDSFGSVDIVVCNAAIRPFQGMLEISEEDWDRVIRNNLSALFYLTKASISGMVERKWGRIIAVSGTDGYTGSPNRAHNVVCKAGVHAFAKATALEFGGFGITANVVAPGYIDTERNWKNYPNLDYNEVVARIPTGRIGTVNDCAYACLYLASEAASYVNGQVIHVNGGMYMH